MSRSSLSLNSLAFLRPAIVVAGCAAFASAASAHDGLDERIASVSARIAARPDDPALWLERGEYHRLQRDWRAALADLRQADAIDAGLAASWLARGRLFVDAHEWNRALAALDEFEKRAPDRAEASSLRARALAAMGRGEDAVLAFNPARARSDCEWLWRTFTGRAR